MRVTVVGCAGSFASPSSAASCYLVQCDDETGRIWTLLLDLGSGAFGPLQQHVDPRTIDAVLLTHLHPDHCADLTGLDVYSRYHPDGHSPRPIVYGPEATWEVLVSQHTTAARRHPDPYFEVRTWEDGHPVEFGPLTVMPRDMEHPEPTFGLRVDGPSESPGQRASFAYSADTDECAGLDDIAAGVDLFLCEAAFLEGRDQLRGMHLTPSRAARTAERARARRLVLTHLQAWTDPHSVVQEAAPHYSGPIELARPGVIYGL